MFHYVGIYVWGGVVNHVEFYEDLSGGVFKMKQRCKENDFDPGEDDAKIFVITKNGINDTPIYSYINGMDKDGCSQ